MGRDRRLVRQAAGGAEGRSGWRPGRDGRFVGRAAVRSRGRERIADEAGDWRFAGQPAAGGEARSGQTGRHRRLAGQATVKGVGRSGRQTGRERRFVRQAAAGGEGRSGWWMGQGVGFPCRANSESLLPRFPARCRTDGRPNSGWLEERKTSRPLKKFKGGQVSPRNIGARR